MLKGTLDRLEGLLSRQFVIGYALPTLFLAILSLALYELVLAERVGPTGWSLLGWYADLSAVLQGIVGLLGTVVFVTLTYVLALITPLLRQALEGRFLPEGMKVALRATHRDRLWHLQERRRRLQPLAVRLQKAKSNLARAIMEARKTALDSPETPVILNEADRRIGQAREAIGSVWQESDLTTAVDERLHLATERTAQAVVAGINYRKDEVEALILRLNDAAEHLADRRSEEDIALAKRRSVEFPRDLLAPTRLGNVAEAIRSRILHIYGMDTDYFWPRLEAVLPATKSLRDEILDGKAKLDAMVLLCCYAVLFTLCWLTIIMIFGAPLWLFFLIAFLGPAAAALFYQLAVQSYLVLGDSMRSAVDLHRFDLLKALKVDLPTAKVEEREIWTRLQKSLVYGESDALSYDQT